MAHKVNLFTPLTIKSLEFKNRIWMSPMCQYSSRDGHPTDWHFIHLGSRAVGGAGLVMVEATAVTPEGRISPDDSGIWADEHIASFKRVTDFVKMQGARVGIQLAHAGRKGSTAVPWLGGKGVTPADRGWVPLAPSAIAFEEKYIMPREMTQDDIHAVIHAFELAATRALQAGFEVLELHMAHGYLMHEFLSPLSNQRQDEYGGSLENRLRFPLAVARAVRKIWPQNLPLFARISATDWAPDPVNSWNLNDSITLARELKASQIDLIDCSSGGTLPHAEIPIGPGYQVPFAQAIKKDVNIFIAAVGMITDPVQAETILVEQQADAIFMAREFLRSPYWPYQAAKSFGVDIEKPKQYARS